MKSFLDEIQQLPLFALYDEMKLNILYIEGSNGLHILEAMTEVEVFCQRVEKENPEVAEEIRSLAVAHPLLANFEEILEQILQIELPKKICAGTRVLRYSDERGLYSLPLAVLASPKDISRHSPPMICLEQAWFVFKNMIAEKMLTPMECIAHIQSMKKMNLPLDRKEIDAYLAQQPPIAMEKFKKFLKQLTAARDDGFRHKMEKQETLPAPENKQPDISQIPEINSRQPDGIN
ncbi:hypothetical protein KKC32_04580 [Patescibacteria group bacterium]|nr:hypothetical protein [Patescibacteria group bacterium]